MSATANSSIEEPTKTNGFEDNEAPSATTKDFDSKWLDLAFDEAVKALEEGEVPVGCVFVRNNRELIASGRNAVNKTKNATRHAELECIDQVLKAVKANTVAAAFEGVDVYVNVEPCVMCACALAKVGGIRSVFYGCRNPRFGGCGTVVDVQGLLSTVSADFLPASTSTGIRFSGGHRAEDAVDLLKQFYKGENPNAPEDKRKPSRT